MVEELLHYFCCFECNSLFAIGCVKGCSKHVSSVVGAARYCSLTPCRFHPLLQTPDRRQKHVFPQSANPVRAKTAPAVISPTFTPLLSKENQAPKEGPFFLTQAQKVKSLHVRYFGNPCDRDPPTGNFKNFKFFQKSLKTLNPWKCKSCFSSRALVKTIFEALKCL